MYLPVLLVRDFQLWGWIVFALPNVLGAAAMGTVLANADRSRKLMSQHLHAGAAFSIVTIAFHVFFVGWVLPMLFGQDNRGFAIAGSTFLLAGVFYMIGGARRDLVLAAVVLLVSVAAIVIALTQPLDVAPLFRLPDPSLYLLALAPVCVFGFFLCPYLDLTFHRARQETAPAAGSRAFKIGFGVMFLTMIVFTLLYARWMDSPRTNGVLRWAIGLHMAIQIAFTLAVHVRSMLVSSPAKSHRVGLVVAVLISLGLILVTRDRVVFRRMDSAEVVYRSFMGFYGLVFPAYVWLCMIPLKDGRTTPDPDRLIRFAVAVVLALPFFWLGFIEKQYGWLLAGLAIVIGMRWTIRTKKV